MTELESLMIYKQYVELMYYTHDILLKFPKCERFALAADIKNTTSSGLKKIIGAHKEYNKAQKLAFLNALDVDLKVLKVFIRISHKRKYITSKNYMAWSKKITNISNLMGGWIRSCASR